MGIKWYQGLGKIGSAKIGCRLVHQNRVCMGAHQFCSRHSARHQIFCCGGVGHVGGGGVGHVGGGRFSDLSPACARDAGKKLVRHSRHETDAGANVCGKSDAQTDAGLMPD